MTQYQGSNGHSATSDGTLDCWGGGHLTTTFHVNRRHAAGGGPRAPLPFSPAARRTGGGRQWRQRHHQQRGYGQHEHHNNTTTTMTTTIGMRVKMTMTASAHWKALN